MIKNNPRYKTEIKVAEKIGATNLIFNSYFNEDETTGTTEFTPYYREIAQVHAFAEFFLDGVEFEENDDIYESVISDDELKEKYQECSSLNNCFLNILSDVYEMVNFKKEQIIHSKKSSMDEIFDMVSNLLSTLNDKAKEIDTKKLEKILKKLNAQEILKKYQESGIGNDLRDKTIHEQSKEIKELKNKLGAVNVLADK